MLQVRPSHKVSASLQHVPARKLWLSHRSPHSNARCGSVKAGNGDVSYTGFHDSTALLVDQKNCCSELRARLLRDGYLFLKRVVPVHLVAQAQSELLHEIHRSNPRCVSESGEWLQGSDSNFAGLLSRQDLAQRPAVRAVLEGEELVALTSLLLQVPAVKTTSFKWLRAVPPTKFTGLHTDRVFLGGGSERLLTVWIPFQAVRPEAGSVLVCRGSHRSRGFAALRDSYGATSVGLDGTRSGWLTDDGSALNDILGAKRGWIDWRTGEIDAGDVVVLHQDVLHMTACNQSGRLRLSCDTRWQPAADAAHPKLGSWTELQTARDPC